MPQNTNLNVSPYFDDFSDSKNYQRVLFKPGTPIQARELTTLQSILQNQIEKFGKNLFKEGSMVIPGQIAYDPEYTCVQIDEVHLGIPISLYVESLLGKLIQGETSGVKAKVENYITSSESERNTYTLYIKYQSSSDSDFLSKTFVDGENLIALEDISYSLSSIRSGSTFATSILTNSTSIGSAAKIVSGVYFIRGFFITVNSETVVLDQYTNSPSYRVGLLVNEEIVVASNEYSDLFDNAQGFSNYAAPGADRLKISTSLIKKSINDFNDENFIELLRVEDGSLQKFVKETNYNLIRDELAKRTYDESGDYYITPFDITPKECLNDRIGNNGIYFENQVTKQGNPVSKDLLCLSVSPGKAYVRGYEVETINNTIIDLNKPRTTDNDYNQAIPFNLGRQINLNNVTGTLPVGFGTTSYVNLYNGRTGIAGISSGTQIGVARVYDLKLKNSVYVNNTTQFETSLYDIQTYTNLTLNTSLTQSIPAFIQGNSSGASGYLVNSISSSNILTLYQVSGSFANNETININGNTNVRTVIGVRDYNFSDIHQIVGNGVSFTADPVLSNQSYISQPGTVFTISIASAGISTITTTDQNFYVGINTGDIISYAKQGDTLPTYNQVYQVSSSAKSIQIVALPSISGVCVGTLPTSTFTNTDIRKSTLDVLNTTNVSLYSKLNKSNISNLTLTGSDITIKRSYNVTITNGAATQVLETDVNLTLLPFNEQDYNLAFANGTVESLSDQKLTVSGRTISLQNISQNGSAVLTVSFNKINASTKKKIFNRCTSLIVDKSTSQGSGIGSTTFNDGLSYSQIYGTRVQDREISLNVPDVSNVIAIIESSTSGDPSLSYLQLINLSSNILNSVTGELIVGTNSKSVATLVSSTGTNQIDIVYLNENIFTIGELVTFQESKIQATITTVFPGDKNIKNNFIFDDGQRSEYLDYSRIIRKPNNSSPTRKIKIIFNNYTINSSDNGDFVGVNSYDKDRYDDYIPSVDGKRVTDLLDCRPRVSQFNSLVASPFEFKSRIFQNTNGSATDIFAKNKNINLSYDYYLPRIDRIFLDKDGAFIVNKGIPSLSPKVPNSLDSSLEIGTVYLPAYLFDASSVKISLTTHKRYRMQDISSLDRRITNIEYYTSLSLLETDTQNLTIRDSTTQLDRFKCGFFVDNFKSSNGGDISNRLYKSSIDKDAGTLNPQPYSTSIDLLIGSESILGIGTTSNVDADLRFVNDLGSPNLTRVGDVVCLKYSDVEYVKNPYATRTENVNPFNVVNWIGTIQLSPSSDTWVETRKTEKISDIEGSYSSAIQQLGVDTNTGLSPVDWGSWETTWTGAQATNGPALFTQQTGSTLTSSTDWVATSGLWQSRNPENGAMMQSQDRTTTYEDSFINFSNQTTITSRNQTRQGIQYGVNQRFDTTNLGDRVVSRDILTYMRSRNIEVIAKRLKPNSQFYAFFDNVDMTNYIIPKLLEVSMISGTFSVGETVIGILGSKSIKFRLATQNHKYGPYNTPFEYYTINPYDVSSTISSSYSSTTGLLNVDTASLELQSNSSFYGCISNGMRLIGQTSGAIADIRNIRLISDNSGSFIGSLFIPDPTSPSTPVFTTGNKTFTLTTSSTNSTISGFAQSSAETNFSSSGTLDNVESTTLRIRNANISRDVKTDDRKTSETDTRLVASTSFINRTVTQTRWVDPLAESFEVADPNGVYLTKCDIFFKSKSTNNLPVTLQVRTMSTGLPTQTILPFAEVILEPDKVFISNDSSVPTTFTFPSPVYLETANSYAIVLLSASDEYNVWISRMTETDVSTLTRPEAERIVVAQQPLLGSLFKSQNGSTWDASQLEDLKMTLYRANFVTSSASVRFYNPSLDIGNNQIAALRPNPIQMYSKSSLVGIGTSISAADQANLINGVQILQKNNSNFSGKLRSVLGGISTGATGTLSITNPGSGYTSGSTTFQNKNLVTVSGYGQGAKANLTVIGGVAVAATVSVGGTGYAIGDVLSIASADTGSLGKNLLITIPNTAGIITSINSLIVDNIQGKLDATDSTKYITYNGQTGIVTMANASVTSLVDITTGLVIKVNHNNHGMYSSQNKVTLSGIEPDLSPLKLSASYSSSSTSDLPLSSSVAIFSSFENIAVGSANTGYINIKNEIIGYTGVNTSTNSLTGIIRGPIAGSYSANDLVFKYELNGVSLKRINKTHTISGSYNIDLDEYNLILDTSTDGADRTTSNVNGYPELFFSQRKSGGTYESISPVVGFEKGPKATQNIPFSIIRPNIQTLLPQTTEISARIRTFSGTSADGIESSFVDQGFEDISLNSNNILNTTRIIASKINESNYLGNYPGAKSFTLEMVLSTGDPKVSPMIDLDRVNIITIMSRLNSPVSNYATDSSVNSLTDDPHAAIYVSKIIKLKQSADNLMVLFDAYRDASSDIRVMYRLMRDDTSSQQQGFELFPGYTNLNNNGDVIDPKDNNGLPNKFVIPSVNFNDLGSYEFTAHNLAPFNGFQIKILMSGTNQALYPKIKDLRAIATKS